MRARQGTPLTAISSLLRQCYRIDVGLWKTSLNTAHRELGARMVDFSGWEMPVDYGSTLKEHAAVREAAGLFDVSHMGEIEIKGRDALAMLQWVTSNDASRLADGQAQYSAFLTPEGTFIDDVVVYRLHAEHVFICVNAANREKDFQWLLTQRRGEVEIEDTSDRYAQLALQGPLSEAVLQPLIETDLSSIRYFWSVRARVGGIEALVSRTGYTGEDGFEIYFPSESAPVLWNGLIQAGAPRGLQPAGLAARNTLRLEMCYALYGHEIDDRTDPWQAGLGWIVKLEKGDFVGRAALERLRKEGQRRKLCGFEMVERGIARDGYRVLLEGRPVGCVTSGSFSPSLKKSIGMVYLPVERAGVGQPIQVEVRGTPLRAQVVETPFYARSRTTG